MQINANSVSTLQDMRRSRARWIVIAPLLCLFSVICQLDKSNMSVIVADRRFLTDLALLGQPARAGLLNTLFVFGYGIGMLGWGFLVDRFGPRRCAILCGCAWGLGTLACAWTTSARELYLARTFLGVAEGCLWPLCNSYIGQWFPVREHARMQSVWINGGLLGIAAGIPVVTLLLAAGGWRVVFTSLGVLSFVLVPLFLVFGADDPSRSAFTNQLEIDFIEQGKATRETNALLDAGAPLMRSLLSARPILIMLCNVASVGTLWGLTTWLPSYLVHEKGLSLKSMGGWVSVSYVVPIVTVYIVGYIADKTMQRTRVAASCAVATVIALLAAIFVPWMAVGVFMLVLVIAAPMIYSGLNNAMLHECVPAHQIGRCTGLVIGMSTIVGSLSPWVMGYLVGAFDGKFGAAFGFIAGLNVALLLLYGVLDAGHKRAARVRSR